MAKPRANPGACDVACGAAETERSAHSAVATTITAITCFVRRIFLQGEPCRPSLGRETSRRYAKIGQSIGMPIPAVKETRSLCTARGSRVFAD